MSDVIKINAITVPADSGDELARRGGAFSGLLRNQQQWQTSEQAA